MTKKDIFVEEIEKILIATGKTLSEEAATYFEALKISGGEVKERKAFTDNGKIVLAAMQETYAEVNNLFKSKTIADGLGISSRTVSGAMRRLVADGYVEKMGENPVIYALTESGKEVDLSNQ